MTINGRKPSPPSLVPLRVLIGLEVHYQHDLHAEGMSDSDANRANWLANLMPTQRFAS